MFKKLLIFTLCATINLHATELPATIPTPISPAPTTEQTESSALDYLTKSVIIIDLAILHLLIAPEPVQQNFFRQLNCPNLAYNFITQYLSWSASTLAHEGGHSIARKLLTDADSIVHFGSAKKPTTAPLLTLGSICIDDINPTQGHTHITDESLFATFLTDYRAKHNITTEDFTPEQMTGLLASAEFKAFKQIFMQSPDNLLITIAGSLSGLIAHHLIQKISTGELTVNHITANQLSNLLLPFDSNSDAAVLWRHGAGIPDSVITTICERAIYIDILIEISLAIKETADPTVTPLCNQVLIGLINYATRGYLRFQA